MILEQARKAVVVYGNKLIECGLTTGTGGNLSVRDPETGRIAISPSGMEYAALTPADVTVLEPDGGVADGGRKPSSESPMHRLFYAARPDRHAVVHTHSPAITAYSCFRKPLPPISYIIAMAGGDMIPCAPYRDFGGEALGEAAVRAADGCDAVMLANHGLVCLGADMAAAFELALELEFCAELYMRCLATGERPELLTTEEMRRARERFGFYGQ